MRCCTLVLIDWPRYELRTFSFFAGWATNFEKIKHLLKIIVKIFGVH